MAKNDASIHPGPGRRHPYDKPANSRKLCPQRKAEEGYEYESWACWGDTCALWEEIIGMCSLAVPGHLAAFKWNIENIKAEREAFKSDRK